MQTKSNLTTGAVYLRSNSKNQKSLDAQLERIQKQATEDHVEIVKTYSDTHSGFNNSEVLNTLLEDAKAGKFSVLYCDRLDRLSRNSALIIELIVKLDQYGVGVRSVSQNFDTSTFAGRLITYTLVSLHEYWDQGLLEGA